MDRADELLALPVGGLILGLSAWWWKKSRSGPPVDVVEANALLGGRMGLRDSAFICGQTLVSNGFGASVGLEAAYAQAGGSWASLLGKWMHLRRGDMRTMVAAGAGAGIARGVRGAADGGLLRLRGGAGVLLGGDDRAGGRREPGGQPDGQFAAQLRRAVPDAARPGR